MIPRLDRDIGIDIHSTEFAGCGGKIKTSAADFKVSEILAPRTLDGITQESGYAVYVMHKEGIDTSHALHHVLKRAGQRLKALGLKDAHAVTSQYVCATSKSTKLVEYNDDTVTLEPVGYVPRPLSGKDMVGNAFEIAIREQDGTLDGFSEWEKVLNFFAYQRFGSSRAMTHLVGKAMVMGDWERAADIALRYVSPYELGDAGNLRSRISECKTHSEMLELMPRGMDIERTLATALGRGAAPLEAMGSLSVQIRRFYVQAYQSYIFNCALSNATKSGESMEPQEGDVCYGADGRLGRYSEGSGGELAMPLVGHSYYTKTRFAGAIKTVMETEGVRPSNFALRDMQEAAAEGGFRTVTIRAKEPSIEGNRVRVRLGRGSYATALMREIIKPSDPVAAGLAT